MKTRPNGIMKLTWLTILGLAPIVLLGSASDNARPEAQPTAKTASTETLGGDWRLAVDPKNIGRDQGWFNEIQHDTREAVVPGVIQQVFPGYHGVAWYWLNFRVECRVSRDDRLLIRFGSVDYLADVWVNGKHAGTFEGGETPFEFDITGLVDMNRDNLLAVRVLNPTDEPIDGITLVQTPHINKVMVPTPGCSFNSGGITSLVELRSVPAVSISRLFAQPDSKTGSVTVSVTTRNADQTNRAGAISLKISAEGSGDVIERQFQDTTFAAGESVHELTLSVPKPRLWCPENPFLYRVTAEVSTAGKAPHEQSVRCGFRDFRVVNGFFYINGKRVFLKSTHTGNHMPIGMHVPMDPDFVRRDIINAKASGFNAIRCIGCILPEQLDFCDEIGMMIEEESDAEWLLGGAEAGYSYVKTLYPPTPLSPKLEERYKHNFTEMILRDRNHPSIVMWQLLNETEDGYMFNVAHQFLPLLRALDSTRLVLLSSGRFDGHFNIGTVSNPNSNVWEDVWGLEAPNGPIKTVLSHPSMDGSGDFHIYPIVPQTPETNSYLRNLGNGTKPVLLSEYGIGSLFDVIGEWKHFEQVGARPDLEDASWLKEQSDGLRADWNRLGFDDVYPFVEDMLHESQRLSARQRTIGFNLIRSNPNLCGYNLTGMLDHAMTGEGVWKLWREFKPSMFDAVSDGWAPLRWCLFAEPLNVYSGRTATVEAVLANEDVLKPGEYHARFRIFGPQGPVWEKIAVVKIPNPPVLAVPVIRETFEMKGPPGRYVLEANREEGAATGGQLTFFVADPAKLPPGAGKLALWGIDKGPEEWLTAHGFDCRQLTPDVVDQHDVVLVGKPADSETNPKMWQSLTALMANGSTVVFVSGQIFREGNVGAAWLPSKHKGFCRPFIDHLYHKECVAKRHPVFGGLQGPGIMDWDYYGQVIPHDGFEGLDTPDETIAASFATGYFGYPRGYGSSLLIAMYKQGEGRLILSTPYVLENLNSHPAADRLLLNLISYAQGRNLPTGQ